MTREEILAMEAGREMDALIAEKVMGYKWYRIEGENRKDTFLLSDQKAASNNNGIRPNYPLTGFYQGWDSRKLVPCKRGAIDPIYPSVPAYSINIADALSVIDHLEPKDFSTYTYDNGWGARIDSDFTVRAETLPLAICRAALLAVMEAQ